MSQQQHEHQQQQDDPFAQHPRIPPFPSEQAQFPAAATATAAATTTTGVGHQQQQQQQPYPPLQFEAGQAQQQQQQHATGTPATQQQQHHHHHHARQEHQHQHQFDYSRPYSAALAHAAAAAVANNNAGGGAQATTATGAGFAAAAFPGHHHGQHHQQQQQQQPLAAQGGGQQHHHQQQFGGSGGTGTGTSTSTAAPSSFVDAAASAAAAADARFRAATGINPIHPTTEGQQHHQQLGQSMLQQQQHQQHVVAQNVEPLHVPLPNAPQGGARQQQQTHQGFAPPGAATIGVGQLGGVYGHHAQQQQHALGVPIQPQFPHQQQGATVGGAGTVATDGGAGGNALQMGSAHQPAAPSKPRPPKKPVVPYSEAWNIKYRMLVEYHKKHGHADVPQSFDENRPLGKWVGKQREHWRAIQQGKPTPLTEERIEKLKELDFKFTIGRGQHYKIREEPRKTPQSEIDGWEAKFAELEAYKAVHGNCDVPVKMPEKRRPLGRWVAGQRSKWKAVQEGQIKPTPLLEERFERLRSIGFNFKIRGAGGAGGGGGGGGTTLQQERKWDDNLAKLVLYKEKHGDCDVPFTYADDPALARWVAKQRDAYKVRVNPDRKGSTMSDDRLARLAAVGFRFSLKTHLAFDEHLAELKKYMEEHGTLDVCKKSHPTLCRWVDRNRDSFRAFMEGKPSSMNNDRIKQLEAIGFNWKFTPRKLDREKLKEFDPRRPKKKREIWTGIYKSRGIDTSPVKQKHRAVETTSKPAEETTNNADNVSNSPVNIVAVQPDGDRNNPALSGSGSQPGGDRDITHQNRKMSGNESQDDAQERKAESPHVAEQLQEGQRSDRPTPVEDQPVATQEAVSSPKEKPESEDQTDKQAEPAAPLEETAQGGGLLPEADLPPMPDVGGKHKKGTIPELWNRQFRSLLKFKQEYGHTRVPKTYAFNPQLATWVRMQRQHYKSRREKKLTPMCDTRVKYLEHIGFEWVLKDTPKSWAERFEELKTFQQENGHCNVTQACPLGKFVSKQRDAYRFLQLGKPSTLTPERKEKLESIGFTWLVGRGKGTRTWDQYFDDLKKFKEEHGHTNIPVGYKASPALGRWAYNQRLIFRAEMAKTTPLRVALQRIQMLKDVGFDFHVDEEKLISEREKAKAEKEKRKAVLAKEKEERRHEREKHKADRVKLKAKAKAKAAAKGKLRSAQSARTVGSPRRRSAKRRRDDDGLGGDEIEESTKRNIRQKKRQKRGRPRKSETNAAPSGGRNEKKVTAKVRSGKGTTMTTNSTGSEVADSASKKRRGRPQRAAMWKARESIREGANQEETGKAVSEKSNWTNDENAEDAEETNLSEAEGWQKVEETDLVIV